MAKHALIFGALLILLGVASFVATGSTHPTALIPAYFGAGLVIAGVMALKPGLRMHAMHAAAVVGTLGFVGSLVMVIKAMVNGIGRPVAFICQVIMLLLCGAFVGLCVKSFRAARRNRIGDAN